MKVQILHGDAITKLKELPDNSVHCCITSPPYWGLRDYGTAQWEGGDPKCDHKVASGGPSMLQGASQRGRSDVAKGNCPKCGAVRIDNQIGLEPTIEEYVAKMVEVFWEVRRVLRADGTLWLNMGDSYAGSGGAGEWSKRKAGKQEYAGPQGNNPNRFSQGGLKPKNLCMIPARVALALQKDGWYLRSDIIWAKGNPMPQSVTDRPATSHEYIFLLTKSAKYYFDAEAIREPVSGTANLRGKKDGSDPSMDFKMQEPGKGNRNNTSFQSYMKDLPPENGRNCQSVWNINTASFPSAHFATFPPAIPERCIKAGTSEKGCCPKCKAGWRRVMVKTDQPAESHRGSKFDFSKSGVNGQGRVQSGERFISQTAGWQPTCYCFHTEADLIPAIVLDPFSGAGTTGLVAAKMDRDAVLIELNPEYCQMAGQRIRNDLGMLAEVKRGAGP